MTVLPVVERELRVAARRPSTTWNRALAALVAILICTWFFLLSTRMSIKELGVTLFAGVSGLFFCISLLSGIRFTADCLSEEKREGTLGLLFLTDLKGYDIVLGKLVATSINAFYGLLAVFPVLGIPLLLGGVAPGQFGRMTIVLANALLFSLSAGLWMSSLCRSARMAMASTLLLVMSVNAFLPGIGALLAYYHPPSPVNEAFLIPSAGYSYVLAFDQMFRANPGKFLVSSLWTLGFSIVFLVMACICARYGWQDRPPGSARSRVADSVRRWTRFGSRAGGAIRARFLDVSPCLWLGARHRLKPVWVWMFLALMIVLWIWGLFRWGNHWLSEAVYLTTALVLHTTFKCWIASEACQKLGPDHRNGALELLLSTPMSVQELLRGHRLALHRQFLWPMVVVVIADIFMMAEGLKNYRFSGELLWIWTWIAGIAVFVADMYTLSWVSMYTGLTARHPNRAAATAVAWVMLFPWIAWCAVLILVESFSVGRGIVNQEMKVLLLWVALGLLFDLLLCVWIQTRLRRDLRLIAAQKYVPPRPWLARLLSSGRSQPPRVPSNSHGRP